ncbi:hypothetical protein McpSp1_04940 [Methanocorpusculaceae archaeon Sp1]|nr:hypothetical protein [Methanocorpusculaceae archaeon Sp1]
MLDQLMKGMMPDGGKEKTKEEKSKKSEFEGFAECLLFSETARITVDEDALLITTALDQLPIPYGEIISFVFTNYRLEIVTVHETITISQMGQTGQWLYDHLYAAYNAAVLKAFLVEGSPEMEVRGSFETEDAGGTIQGEAVVRLYKNCVCILPANDHGRRIPLCFVSEIEKGNFSLTLSLLTGERYMLSKMGYETDHFIGKVTEGLRSLRERSVTQLQECDSALRSMQAAMAAKLMPEGVNAAVGKLSAAAPTLMAELEKLIKESRISGSYPVLKRLCGDERLFFGMKAPVKEEGKQPTLSGMPVISGGDGSNTSAAVPGPQKPLFWLIAVGRETAAVELALPGDEAAATYLYRIEGEPETFALILNRGMEATDFRRELFTLTDEELAKPGRMTEAMLIHRTPALQLMRKCFVGRVIHSSPDKWEREMEKYLSSIHERGKEGEQQTRFCTNCGTKISNGAKFCGECGAKISL